MGRLLTVADFAVMPERLPSGDVRLELDDGRLVVKPLLTCDQSECLTHVLFVLTDRGEFRGYGQSRGRVGIILRKNPDRVVAPDAAFILSRSLPPRTSVEDYLETIPELVVEIRSKNDSTPDVNSKVDEYLHAGVKIVWVIDPERRTVAVHTRDRAVVTLTERDTLTAEGLIPGFAVPVSFVLPAP